MFKKIGLICFALMVVALIIIAIIRKPKQIKITTVRESYNQVVLSNDDYKLNIRILVNQKNAFITNIDEISNAYIGNNDDLYKAEVCEINYGNYTLIENEKFYEYSFYINLDLKINIEIENAFLYINYLNQKDIAIDIGSISLYRINENSFNDFSITNLKGVVNQISGKKTLVGIVFDIKSNECININNISLFDLNTYISGIYDISQEVINYSDNIDLIINKEYNLNDEEIIVNKLVDKTKSFIITLGYKRYIPISELEFYIYEHN